MSVPAPRIPVRRCYSGPVDLAWWEELLRLVIAAFLGAAVGFDREVKQRPAGLRTMTLVSVGAAAFVLMGIHALASVDNIDLGRILAGVAGGVGFLGAGVIIQSGGKVKGVTTAATVWVAAAIGSSAAVGAYALAALITVLTILVLWPMQTAVEDKINGSNHADPPDDDADSSR